jgi:hypothetical protein
MKFEQQPNIVLLGSAAELVQTMTNTFADMHTDNAGQSNRTTGGARIGPTSSRHR